MLDKYAEIKSKIYALEEELKKVVTEIEAQVVEGGEISGYGYRAYMKPGRKSTDHEAAARAADVSQGIVDKHSTTKVTVAWASVTKEAGCSTIPFTTQAAPSFVIDTDVSVT